MRAEVKQAWVEALRSGKYEQGTSWLAQQFANGARQYCCLGVLCAVTEQPYTVATGEDGAQYLDFGQTSDENDAEEIMPTKIARDFGLPSRNPKLPIITKDAPYGSQRPSLASLNDDGFTFDQIADLIEYFIPADEDGEGLHYVTSGQSAQRSTSDVTSASATDVSTETDND